MMGRFAVVAVALCFVSSCGGSSGTGGVDAGTGGATGTGGANPSGGATGSGGAGGAPAGGSGLAGSRTLSGLSTAEKGQFCDWSAGLWGGYNQTRTCPNGEATNQVDLADCLAKFPSCAATVTQFEACNRKMASMPCDLFAALGSAECAPLLTCL